MIAETKQKLKKGTGKAKNIFKNMTRILISRELNYTLKMRTAKYYENVTLLYATKTSS